MRTRGQKAANIASQKRFEEAMRSQAAAVAAEREARAANRATRQAALSADPVARAAAEQAKLNASYGRTPSIGAARKTRRTKSNKRKTLRK